MGVWVKENMGVLEVLRLVEEAISKGLRGRRMWDTMEGNTGEGEEVDEAVVVEERDRIEKKLRKTLANIGFATDVKLFNTALREYGVLLTNNRSLVVNLAEKKCSCKWSQLKGLPCAHAVAVIDMQKLWVYDYVSDCYKAGSQSTIYMNSIHPMEMHDSATVDNTTGLFVGGEALDDGYNRRILSPLNPRPQGRPQKRRIES
ncbi:hypothetical protein Cgig2_011343 [Carnegiea gigantea]|uniref:SWIM-type domain-containing protein n=1 Tax=Carnegiea gigantea TaxID=171969 RepID=A0A9Q1JTQ7_9CARY|nr:hypothetical protein Cgig2_011343 [Carnegiea gigantea]